MIKVTWEKLSSELQGNIKLGTYIVQTETQSVRGCVTFHCYGGTSSDCYVFGSIETYGDATAIYFYGNVNNYSGIAVARANVTPL